MDSEEGGVKGVRGKQGRNDEDEGRNERAPRRSDPEIYLPVSPHVQKTHDDTSLNALHTLTHKGCIYIYILYIRAHTQPHTPPRRAATARPQLQASLTGHKSDPDGLMVDL